MSPLGRGGSCGYYGPAEQDVLDVMDDIAQRFEIDDDRVVLTGISQGGFATFRLGELYPDRFSALVPLVGQSALVPEIEMMISGGEPFMPDTLENLCNIPIRMVNGRLDPLKNSVAGNVPDLDALALHKLEYDFRYWQLLRRGHEVIPELTNGVFLDVLERPRDPNPARVVFSVEPFLDACEPDTGLELRHDAAYWVSGSRVRGDTFVRGDKGTVDVTTLARRRPRAGAASVRDRRAATTRTSRARPHGPEPAGARLRRVGRAGRSRSRPGRRSRSRTASPRRSPASPRSPSTSTGCDSTRQQELTATVTGDGRTDLHLRGGWQGPVKVSTRSSSEVLTPGRRHAHAGARLPRRTAVRVQSPAGLSDARSWSTIVVTSSSNDVDGFQPSSARACDASPTSRSTSAGRKSRSSVTTWSLPVEPGVAERDLAAAPAPSA